MIVTEDRDFIMKLKISRIVLVLVASIASFCMFVLSPLMEFPTKFMINKSFSVLLGMFLSISLMLLLVKDFVHRALVKELMVLIAYVLIALYTFLGSMIDIVSFKSCNYMYIPPMFILLTYQPSISTLMFKSVAISIPLGIAFIIFIHGLYDLIKTVITARIEYRSEVKLGLDTQEQHDVSSQGQYSNAVQHYKRIR